jgi:hypothetical protein
MGYQGWTNYETWAVNLWLSNEEPLYRDLVDMARDADDADELAQSIRSYVDNMAPDLGASLWSDLLTSALGEVDWDEIAKSWWEDEHDDDDKDDEDEEDEEEQDGESTKS